jgi:hypothetical protein
MFITAGEYMFLTAGHYMFLITEITFTFNDFFCVIKFEVLFVSKGAKENPSSLCNLLFVFKFETLSGRYTHFLLSKFL